MMVCVAELAYSYGATGQSTPSVHTQVHLHCCWLTNPGITKDNFCLSRRHCLCVRQLRDEAQCMLPHALRAVLCMVCLEQQALQPPTLTPSQSNTSSMTPSQVPPQTRRTSSELDPHTCICNDHSAFTSQLMCPTGGLHQEPLQGTHACQHFQLFMLHSLVISARRSSTHIAHTVPLSL